LQRRLPFGAAEGWFPEVCSQARKRAAIMTVRHPPAEQSQADHRQRDCRVNDWRNFENFIEVTSYRFDA